MWYVLVKLIDGDQKLLATLYKNIEIDTLLKLTFRIISDLVVAVEMSNSKVKYLFGKVDHDQMQQSGCNISMLDNTCKEN